MGESLVSCHDYHFSYPAFSKSLQTMEAYHPSSCRSISEELPLPTCEAIGTDMDAFTNPSRDGLETTIFKMLWDGRTNSSCNVSRSAFEIGDFYLLVVASNNKSSSFHYDFGTYIGLEFLLCICEVQSLVQTYNFLGNPNVLR